jgi:GTPase
LEDLTKVILVTYPDRFRLEEAKSLSESLQNKIIKVFTQKYLDRAEYGMGSGKAEEIKNFVKEHSADEIQQIIVDEHLTTRQIHNLEKLTELQVIDRERLILNIFSSRATTTESKLQIELAEIKYQFPRVREASKIIARGESPGKGGMGEYVVDVKLRELKRQVSSIQQKLEYARRKRELYHRQRMETNFPVVSLVGYTSSGKTTLFNLLTESDKEVSDELFTTLSTTTRSLVNNNDDSKVLLVDTVGFIDRLPHYMIDAFKSTLEESLGADLILLLIDSSEEIEDIRIKYSSCWTVLGELGVDRSKVRVILTKYDDKNMHSEKIKEIANSLELSDPMVISSKCGYGIRKLKTMISQVLLPHHAHSAIITTNTS